MKILTVRVDDNIFAQLDKIAINSRQSMNKVINKMIEKELLKPSLITNCIEGIDNKINILTNTIDKIEKKQNIHYKITKQHFANRAFLSNANVKEDKCLNEILDKANRFND